tara:strand:+ start:185 stop:355 length:171 start_codon:yes stop_codon:yes gene_type:complete
MKTKKMIQEMEKSTNFDELVDACCPLNPWTITKQEINKKYKGFKGFKKAVIANHSK